MFKVTSFRMKKDDAAIGRINRSASTIEDVSNFKKRFDMQMQKEKAEDLSNPNNSLSFGGFGGLKSMSTVAGLGAGRTKLDVDTKDGGKRASLVGEEEQKKELKHTFKPFNNVENSSSKDKATRSHLHNLDPVSYGDMTVEINLRSLVNMDNEPTHFL